MVCGKPVPRRTCWILSNSLSSFLSSAFCTGFSLFSCCSGGVDALPFSADEDSDASCSAFSAAPSLAVSWSSYCFLASGRSSTCASSARVFCDSISSFSVSDKPSSAGEGGASDGSTRSSSASSSSSSSASGTASAGSAPSAAAAVVGGGGGGTTGASGSSLGRNAELMSPIPTKKSSSIPEAVSVPCQYERFTLCKLTRDDLDKVRGPLPDVGAVINDNNH